MNKHEMLYLYDVQNSNPNGNVLDENRPRYDYDRRLAEVSDVRVKRTLRDYLFEFHGYNGENGKDIYCRTKYNDDGTVYTSKDRSQDYENNFDALLNSCIDARYFGCVAITEEENKPAEETEESLAEEAPKGKKKNAKKAVSTTKGSMKLIGPIQVGTGKSLHETLIETIQGTGAFASGENKNQQTFRTEHVLPYALIGHDIVLCNKNAEKSKLTDEDVDLFKNALWESTKNINTRTKFGQMPQLFLDIEYKDSFHIGRLRDKISVISNGMPETSLRSTKDYVLDVTELIDALNENDTKINKISFRVNKSLKTVVNGNEVDLTTYNR